MARIEYSVSAGYDDGLSQVRGVVAGGSNPLLQLLRLVWQWLDMWEWMTFELHTPEVVLPRTHR